MKIILSVLLVALGLAVTGCVSEHNPVSNLNGYDSNPMDNNSGTKNNDANNGVNSIPTSPPNNPSSPPPVTH